MKKILLLLIMLFIHSGMYANGDPITSLSALHRSSNPTPRDIVDIHIVREDLHIKPGVYTTVKVKYMLWNASDKDYNNIDYGFPVDYQGTGDKYVNSPLQGDYYSDSSYMLGWHDDYIINIVFFANGTALPFSVSDETIVEKPDSIFNQNQEDIETYGEWDKEEAELYYNLATVGRRWFYTQFSIKAGETLILEVQYSLRNARDIAAWSGIDISNRMEGGLLHYDLAPAVHWGNGKARDFYVEIDVSEIDDTDNRYNLPDDYKRGASGLPFSIKGDKLVYQTRNFNFKNAKPIIFSYRNKPFPDLAEWMPCRISNDKYVLSVSDENKTYPASNLIDMDLETAWAVPWKKEVGDTITITFKQPTRIGAIIVLGGYHRSKKTFTENHSPSHIVAQFYGMKQVYNTKEEKYTNKLIEDIVNWADIWEQPGRKYEIVTFDNILHHAARYDGTFWQENGYTKIKLWIKDIFPGTKYNDMCISEIILLNDFAFPERRYQQ